MNQMVEEHISTTDLVKSEAPQTADREAGSAPLLPGEFISDLRSRWDRIQAGFVDEPRTAVQQADELVGQAVKRLAESFSEARNNLERQWDSGEDASTEDLRQALRKYRSFFERLLSV